VIRVTKLWLGPNKPQYLIESCSHVLMGARQTKHDAFRVTFLEGKVNRMSKNTKSANKVAAATAATPKPVEKAKKEKLAETPEEKMAQIKAKYPSHNIVDKSLLFDEKKQKYSVEIKCQHPGCKNTRRVYTSDLFQVKLCETHTKEMRRKKRKNKRNAMKDALKAATPKA